MSQELDERIAVEIFGWKWMSRPDGYTRLLPPDLEQSETGKGMFGEPVITIRSGKYRISGVGPFGDEIQGARRGKCLDAPLVSSDPAASELLKAEMRRRGWTLVLTLWPTIADAAWRKPEHFYNTVSSALEYESVALAALKAEGKS